MKYLGEIRSLYDLQMRRFPAIEQNYAVQTGEEVVRITGPTSQAGDNCVLYSMLGYSPIENAIELQIRHFKGLNHNFEWKVFDHDPQAEALKKVLLSAGFSADETETVMIFDTKDEISSPTDIPFTIKRLQEVKELNDITKIHNSKWTQTILARDLNQTPDLLTIYGAYDGNRPVGCGWIRFHDRRAFADLWGGTVVPEYRSKGIYRALVELRLQETKRRGVRYLTVDAGQMSHPILEKLGFVALTKATAFVYNSALISQDTAKTSPLAS